MKNKSVKIWLLVGVLVLTFLSLGSQTIFAHVSVSSAETVSKEETKYPIKVMKILRAYLGGDENSNSLDETINAMPKTQVMDIYRSFENNHSNGQLIRDGVNKIFNINLDTISLNGEGSLISSYSVEIMEGVRNTLNGDPSDTSLDEQIMSLPKAEVMDKFLQSYGNQIEGSDIRRVINDIFGVNLDGISSLEYARLSLYSKGQWILQSPNDVFIISSNKGDVGIFVGVTEYYQEKLGTNQFPSDLENFLTEQGFVYNTATKQYEYYNPSGESVSDPFKGLIINTVVAYIQEHYANV